jgi:hypothetical protein
VLSLVTKSPLALSKVAPTRLDCCENGPRRQRRRRGVDSSFSNRFANYFSNTLSPGIFLHTFLVPAAVLPSRPFQSKVKQWFPHGVTFPRPQQHAAALLRSQLSVPGPHARPALHIFLPISFLLVVICALRRTSVKVWPWGGVKSVDARPIEIQP